MKAIILVDIEKHVKTYFSSHGNSALKVHLKKHLVQTLYRVIIDKIRIKKLSITFKIASYIHAL